MPDLIHATHLAQDGPFAFTEGTTIVVELIPDRSLVGPIAAFLSRIGDTYEVGRASAAVEGEALQIECTLDVPPAECALEVGPADRSLPPLWPTGQAEGEVHVVGTRYDDG